MAQQHLATRKPPKTPRPEGTGSPIAKFERIMENWDQATLDKFYHGNMPEVMDGAYNFYGRLAVSRTVSLTVQGLL